ncbi:MAG: hypothetical protein J7J78_00295 [Thermoprotei archaeon]|nr:hypothetical protein [Thermoprotei archaeon]
MNWFILSSAEAILGLPISTFIIAFAVPSAIFAVLVVSAIVSRRRGGSRK